MNGLTGKRVAILEARRSDELVGLLSGRGARPLAAPALEEVPLDNDAEVATFLDGLGAAPAVFILMTGVGTRALFAAAERLGRGEELRQALTRPLVVARGPKPVAALRAKGLQPHRVVAEPYTTDEILTAIADLDLAGRTVAVQLHGGPSPALARGLEARGAALKQIALYRWALPRDPRPLIDLIDQLEGGDIDATIFTSQIQVAHLFAVATEHGHGERLLAALNERTVVASVGPVCSKALTERGVRVGLQPTHPKMGALVAELAAWFDAPQPS